MSILALTSDTLVGTAGAGQIEYNGQFFGTDSAGSRAQLQRIVRATAVASTSGTSIDFTGLPAWVTRITVMFNGVSTSGTSNLLIRFGAGSVDTSGYASVNGSILGTNSTNINTDTSGHLITPSVSAATNHSGTAILSLIGSNTWIVNGTSQRSDGIANTVITTKTALSGALDRVRITTVNGTDTFDAGSVNILYEG
jgi:hypothetical protein